MTSEEIAGGFTWDHVLYRFYDAGGQLLYVGLTRSIRARFRNHSLEQPWWPEVVDCRVEFLPSRDALEAAEKLAITQEAPRYNIRHNGDNIQRWFETERRPDGYTHDEWAWMHSLPPYGAPRSSHLAATPEEATA